MLLRCFFMATKDKPNNKNLRALFSVICLCIIALGLIVYFSLQTGDTTDVNEATTVAETTEVQNRVTVKDTTAQSTQAEETSKTTASAKKSTTTTEAATMEQSDTNIPYESFYKYLCDETVVNGYTESWLKTKLWAIIVLTPQWILNARAVQRSLR